MSFLPKRYRDKILSRYKRQKAIKVGDTVEITSPQLNAIAPNKGYVTNVDGEYITVRPHESHWTFNLRKKDVRLNDHV